MIKDAVQQTGASLFGNEPFEREYNNDETENVQLDASEYKSCGMEPHSFDQNKPQMIQKAIDEKKVTPIK